MLSKRELKRKHTLEQTLPEKRLHTNPYISQPDSTLGVLGDDESAKPVDSEHAQPRTLDQRVEGEIGDDDMTFSGEDINAVLVEKISEISAENQHLHRMVRDGVLAGIKSVKDSCIKGEEIARLRKQIADQANVIKKYEAKSNEPSVSQKTINPEEELTAKLAASASSLRFKNQKIRALQQELKKLKADFELADKDRQIQAQADQSAKAENSSQLGKLSRVAPVPLSPRTFMIWHSEQLAKSDILAPAAVAPSISRGK